MKLSKRSHLAFGLWLPIALAITILSGGALWSVQQNYRSNANDPQIQIVQDSLADLIQVPDLAELASAFGKTDASQTLAPFLIVYDESGKAVAGNGYINDQLPTPSAGTFAEAKRKSESRFTWEPQKGLRFAAVLKPFEGQQKGFILAARNLREIEKRELMLAIGMGIAWVVSMLLSLAWCFFLAKWLNKHFASHEHTHETHHTA
jgi:hypothetical protein